MASFGTVLGACLLMAAHTYSLPPAALMGIYQVESGQVGQEVGPNDNGTYDIGPMQINTIWLPELAGRWGVSKTEAREMLRDDPCTNAGVAAWILRRHMNETGNLSKAIAHYHSRTPHIGGGYRHRVLSSIQHHGLIPPRK